MTRPVVALNPKQYAEWESAINTRMFLQNFDVLIAANAKTKTYADLEHIWFAHQRRTHRRQP